MIKLRHTQRGAALLIFVILFVVAGAALTTLLARSIFTDLAAFSATSRSQQAYITAESLLEDVVLRRISGGYSIDSVESLTLASSTATATSTYNSGTDQYTVVASGALGGAYRSAAIVLEVAAGNAFNYGLQAGNGGITMSGSASIIGNAFANGPIIGAGPSLVRGDVISAGPAGSVDGVTATGSVYAVTITNSEIGGDAIGETVSIGSADQIGGNVTAYTLDIGSGNQVGKDVIAYTIDDGTIFGNATYCNKLNGTTVVGTDSSGNCTITAPMYQATTAFPIPDSLIEAWKQNIEDTGSVIAATDSECTDGSGTYVIEDDTTLGNVKIECNLEVRKKGAETRLTVDGPIWVEGNINFKSGPIVDIDDGLGRQSVQIIADDESNRTTGSKIVVENSTEFEGVTGEDAYVMLVSMNESAELGGLVKAIDLGNSSAGDLLVYAPHGLVNIGQSLNLKEVTGYEIVIGNNSDVIYESGLANLLFTGGPGGSYVITDWMETY